MKKALLLVIGFLLICNIANADIYVLINSTTKEVRDISPLNDAVVEAGYEKIVLPGNLSDYEFTDDVHNYFYKNKKFVKNLDKIDKQEQEKAKDIEKAQEEKLIQDKVRQMAIDELKKEGVVLKWAGK